MKTISKFKYLNVQPLTKPLPRATTQVVEAETLQSNLTFENVYISLHQVPSTFTLFLARARGHNAQVGILANGIVYME